MTRKSWRGALGGCLLIGLGLVAHRWFTPDPRDQSRVFAYLRATERDRFRERLRRGDERVWAWPGLSAMQTSWAWLEMLYGISKAESYEGDFSWMFSKLNEILRVARSDEVDYLTGLAPFYLVIGSDHPGSSYLLNEIVKRAPGSWRAWYWGGFHAQENLKNYRLSGDWFAQAAQRPGAPDFLAPLSLRLSLNLPSRKESQAFHSRLIDGSMPPELVEKIRRQRPEWFQQ